MNEYMKVAKELANDNLKTNAGGPFTKEDAANIGFRDDYIYNYIGNLSKNMQDNSVLELNCMDRNETIEEFNKFVSKSDKIIY